MPRIAKSKKEKATTKASKKTRVQKKSPKNKASKSGAALAELLDDPAVTPGDSIDFERTWFVLHGLEGSGKTTTAWSIADEWEGFPRKNRKKVVEVVSTIGITTDNSSIDGLIAQGYRFPYLVNIPAIMDREGVDLYGAWDMMLEFVEKALEADSRITKLVFDAASTFAGILEDHFLSAGGMEGDMRQYWWRVQAAHRYFVGTLIPMPLQRVIACHSREAQEPDQKTKDSEALRMDLKRGILGAKILPDISGQGSKHWTRPASLELYMSPEMPPRKGDKKQELEFWAHTMSTEGQTKNRWLDGLDDKEPADLQQIIAKVRKYAEG